MKISFEFDPATEPRLINQFTELLANLDHEPTPALAAASALAADSRGEDEGEYEETGAATSEVDCNGVTFDPEYCGKAKEPFYGSGPREGQWKKRKGVGEAIYDNWYRARLALTTEDRTPPVNTHNAFAMPEQTQRPVPGNVGELMGWISEMQGAGRLTQEIVDSTFKGLNLDIGSLFNKPDPEVLRNIHSLYAVLCTRVL
jgi:hypothetical protein